MRLLVIALALAPFLAAAPAGVEGVVTNSVTGEPVRKVVVTLWDTASRSAYQALSDTAGHFQFDDVAPGQYQISAAAQGFDREQRAFVASRRVSLAADQRIKDFAVRLTPLATISGRVLDENGDPIPGADVTAVRFQYRPLGKDVVSGESVTSNSRGEYRLFDVEPGPWMLKVRKKITPPSVTGAVHGALPEMDYVPAFHPGVRTADEAETVWVSPGAELTQIDLRLRKVPVFHVRGKVEGMAAGAEPAVHDLDESWTVHAKADATFDIAGFPAGRYRLYGESGGNRSALQEVTVGNRDVDGVVFHIESATGIPGSVEGAAKPEAIRVWIEPLAGSGNRDVTVGANGAFTLTQLLPLPYRISTRMPEGMYLKSVHLGPLDVSANAIVDFKPGSGPLTLTLATDPGSVTGTAVSALPGEVPVYVVIVPTGSFEGRIDWIQIQQLDDPTGAFELDDVAPGDYRVFACETTDVNMAQSPEFRKLVEGRSESVTVHAREHRTVNLKVIPAADVEDARRKLR